MAPRVLRAVAVGVVLAVLTGLTMNGILFQRPLPTIDGYYRLLGLHERAEVARDAFGIPRIEAANMHDLFFLQGYITAQDRFAQMDAMRTAAHASVAPPGSGASGDLKLVLEAYAAGVTRFIQQHAERRALPAEIALAGARPASWTAVDSLVIAAAYIEKRSEGSSCVAVGGDRTSRGAPLLAADLRSGAPAPGWYEIGLSGAGVRVVGISLPGVPGLVAGHNGRLTWSFHGKPEHPGQATWTVGGLLAAAFASDARSLLRTFAEDVPFAGCFADTTGHVTALAPYRGRPDSSEISSGSLARTAELARDVPPRGLDIESMRLALGRATAGEAAARIVIDLADLDASKAALSTGQSGHRAAFHYRDQAQLWSAGQLHRLAWTREAVARTEGQLVLRPR